MEHKLTETQLDNLKQIRERGDKVIYNLGMNAVQQYELYNELSKVDNLSQTASQELLTLYGEGELKPNEGIFVTKD